MGEEEGSAEGKADGAVDVVKSKWRTKGRETKRVGECVEGEGRACMYKGVCVWCVCV